MEIVTWMTRRNSSKTAHPNCMKRSYCKDNVKHAVWLVLALSCGTLYVSDGSHLRWDEHEELRRAWCQRKTTWGSIKKHLQMMHLIFICIVFLPTKHRLMILLVWRYAATLVFSNFIVGKFLWNPSLTLVKFSNRNIVKRSNRYKIHITQPFSVLKSPTTLIQREVFFFLDYVHNLGR